MALWDFGNEKSLSSQGCVTLTPQFVDDDDSGFGGSYSCHEHFTARYLTTANKMVKQQVQMIFTSIGGSSGLSHMMETKLLPSCAEEPRYRCFINFATPLSILPIEGGGIEIFLSSGIDG